AIGNAEPGTQLSLLTTFAGVAVQGVGAEPRLAGRAHEQNDQPLLLAVLVRIPMPPPGGAAVDFVMGAPEVPGVTRELCYRLELGAGSVTVRFMMDDVRADNHGIPEPADVQRVAEHIEPLRPVTADVNVAAPIPYPVQVVISELDPDTPAIRSAIED